MKMHRKDGSLIVPKRKSVEPRFMRDRDERKLFHYFKTQQGFDGLRDRMLFVVAIKTGLRCEELYWLSCGDFIAEDAQGRRAIKAKLPVMGKGEVYREVPITAELEAEVEKYIRAKKLKGEPLEADAPFFCSRAGGRLAYRTVQHVVESRCVKAGLVDVVDGGVKSRYSVHDLRHTFAVDYLLSHKDQSVAVVYSRLKQIMGHASIQTTQIYTLLDLDEAA